MFGLGAYLVIKGKATGGIIIASCFLNARAMLFSYQGAARTSISLNEFCGCDDDARIAWGEGSKPVFQRGSTVFVPRYDYRSDFCNFEALADNSISWIGRRAGSEVPANRRGRGTHGQHWELFFQAVKRDGIVRNDV